MERSKIELKPMLKDGGTAHDSVFLGSIEGDRRGLAGVKAHRVIQRKYREMNGDKANSAFTCFWTNCPPKGCGSL